MIRKSRNISFLFLLSVVCCVVIISFVGDAYSRVSSKKSIDSLEYGKINRDLARIAYSGDESLKFDVAWSGGIKIGEIYLTQLQSQKCESCYQIDSLITTSGGIIDSLYPVNDRHLTYVQGEARLPFFCEIWQKQGFGYKAHKIVHYDQKRFTIKKQKDGDPERLFELEGVVHNEFSSFFSSRLMDLEVKQPFLVPTFGDDKRNDVVVQTLKKEKLKNTVLGDVKTLKVSPILTFSGLYDKRGDTVIWYTDDECRVPVRIESKIVIGSLTATLADYANPRCPRYGKIEKKIPDTKEINHFQTENNEK